MQYLFKLIVRNVFRHKLRSALTAIGMVVAIVAFGLLRTIVDAWYAGANATSSTRLVTRNAISLVFTLPISYKNKIRQIDGVKAVSYANWFGGIYINEKNFFPQFAIDPTSYLALYPEYLLSPEQKSAFFKDRKGAIAGKKLAEEYGWKIGDVIPIRGTIYPGNWDFVLRGIYRGADKITDQTMFFFHWDYLNESLKKSRPKRTDHVGIYLLSIERPELAAKVSSETDQVFKNSLAETLTETEKAFQLGFVAMTEAILIVIQIVSLLVIVIIIAVMANTMAMTARERRREYATLKALGFGPFFISGLIFGESLFISLGAGVIGILLTYPAADYVGVKAGAILPVVNVENDTVWMAAVAALFVGLVAACIPSWRAVKGSIVEGLGSIG